MLGNTVDKTEQSTSGSSPEVALGYRIYNKEVYSLKGWGKNKKTVLTIIVMAEDLKTGQHHEVHKESIELMTPHYITKYNLWHLTDLELKELESYCDGEITKEKVEKYKEIVSKSNTC